MRDRVRDAIPAVPDLPNEVRHEENDGQAETEPRPRAGQVPAGPGAEKSDQHRDAQRDDGVLRLQADAEHQSQQQPLAGIRPPQQPDEQQARDRPGELVEADRLKEDVGPHEHRRDEHGQPREDLRQPVATQLCGNQRRDDNGRGAGQNREQSQRGQRTREDRLVEPGQQRGDRWVIDVPHCEMPARGEVVELVAVPAVAVGDRHRHAHLGSDQQEQGCPGRACFDAAKLAQG